MATSNLSNEQLRAALNALEQAIYNHEQWAEELYGALICHLAPDQRDLGPDAHHACRFGQWYYGEGREILEHSSGFTEVEIAHKRMHQYGASLLRASADGIPISINDFEHFVTSMKRLRLEIVTLRRELSDAFNNLDPLTGTPSRSMMLSKLREQRELVARGVQACSVAMVDLDNFKAINDSYGHISGDRVLVDFAHYITAHLRRYDAVFRYGGEEFLIYLPVTDLEAAYDIIDRLREELASLRHEADGHEPFNVTVSCGLTILEPDISVEQTIDRADKALYVAKANGRNQTVIWDASMGAGA